MVGDTVMGLAAPGQALVDVGYASTFVLLSRAWVRHRLSVRAEYFETTVRALIFDDDNDEHRNSITLAYAFDPAERQRLTVELLNIFSQCPERGFVGIPQKLHETQGQASCRVFF